MLVTWIESVTKKHKMHNYSVLEAACNKHQWEQALCVCVPADTRDCEWQVHGLPSGGLSWWIFTPFFFFIHSVQKHSSASLQISLAWINTFRNKWNKKRKKFQRMWSCQNVSRQQGEEWNPPGWPWLQTHTNPCVDSKQPEYGWIRNASLHLRLLPIPTFIQPNWEMWTS